MKFIICNYASRTQTEPYYLNMTFNMLDGCKSTLWNPKEVSAYDIFDTIKPDVFISHISNVTTDAVAYLKENRNIQAIVNITGGNDLAVSSLEKIFIDEGLNCPFFFINGDISNTSSKIKKLSIGFGSDVFLSDGGLKYNIENGVYLNNVSEIKPYGDTYHIISAKEELEDKVDIVLPVTQLSNIYKNYTNFIFRSGFEFIPQVLLDAIFYGNNIFFDVDDADNRKSVSEKIKKAFRTDMDITDKDSVDAKELKRCVLKRHTCLHKAKSLLSQFSCKEQLENIDKLIELYTKDRL
jgi:hypothetical protein